MKAPRNYGLVTLTREEFLHYRHNIIRALGLKVRRAAQDGSVEFTDGSRLFFVTGRNRLRGVDNMELFFMGRWYERGDVEGIREEYEARKAAHHHSRKAG